MVRESRDSVDVLLVFVSIELLSPFLLIADDISGWSFLSGGVSLRIADIPELAGRLCSGIGIPAL